MAGIDDLVEEVDDRALRARLRRALADLKSRQRFGLVFEEHIPETTALLGLPLVPGTIVQDRTSKNGGLLRVESVSKRKARVCPVEGEGEPTSVALKDLLTVKRFGEPIYPSLSHIGSVERGAAEKAHHAVIEGENFHALQLLRYVYRGLVDCIYIDPPYNTGARDWKYNNRYVDENDSWRHSKWLSMMERRLVIAKELLSPEGVLVVTIDEHEVSHLGLLLERVFPQHLRHLVTIVHNPKGTFRRNFARVEEYAFFCAPDPGYDVIAQAPDGMFAQAGSPEELEAQRGKADTEDLYLRRRGQESGKRSKRPNQFYAIYVDEDERKVVGVGPLLAAGDEYDPKEKKGHVASVYPLDTRDDERVWRYNRETMSRLIENGEIVVTGYSEKTGQRWVLNHRKPKAQTKRFKTVWWEKRHDAGAHGSDLLSEYLGESALFPFPKSVYAVRDCLAAVVANKPEALILDFFAGSGTTLHATCLLNDEDGGSRRAILVTNNEVAPNDEARLRASGLFKGDEGFESHGIFRRVTRPRAEAVISGVRPDGQPVGGEHVWSRRRPYAEGFEESVDFFHLGYLDPDSVELGKQFAAIHPALWLAAGGRGTCPREEVKGDILLDEAAGYGVLFRESRFRSFKKKVVKAGDAITHIWLVTNSEEAFAEMSTSLPRRLTVSMLYRDYLLNFEINRGGRKR